jgi:hypothetical protein
MQLYHYEFYPSLQPYENPKPTGGKMENFTPDQAGGMNGANPPTLDEARANMGGIKKAPATKSVSISLARTEKMSSPPPEKSETQPKE